MASKLTECYTYIRSRTNFIPKVALVLGSGLGALAEQIETVESIPYREIPGFPQSTVEGHAGRFVFGYMEGVPLVIMQGRVHYYEGYAMQDVVLPTRVMRMLGAEILFLTNAAGGINPEFHAGDFMIIKDHLSSFVPSALIGPNEETLGPRFPDMSHVYCNDLIEMVKEAANENRIPLQEGIYVQTSGPNFETPAEIRMYRALGADAAGMSTACEAMAGNHAGMKVCGISCISNLASGISTTPLTHAEVQETANRVAPLFQQLIRSSIHKMGACYAK